jgi:phage minor structural protein
MLYILDSLQNTVGVANNSSPLAMPYFNDIHTESLEDVSTYEFSVPADHEDSALIKNVFCENSAVTELLSDVQRPMTMNSTNLTNAVNSVLANSSNWTAGIIEDININVDFNVDDYKTVLEALQDLRTAFNVEMYYTVDLIGTQLANKKVNFVQQRGEVTNVRFDYSYDLVGVSRTENSEQIVTAIVGVGKGDDSSTRIDLTTLPAFDDGDFYHEQGTDWIGSRFALSRNTT